jgi:hypothetical protein
MITAPRWVTLTDIETAITEKQRWIFAKLIEWQTRVEQRALPRIDWRDGAEVPYLGQPVRVQLGSPQGTVAFDMQQAALALPLPLQADPQQIKDRVQGWLQGEAKRLFGERLAIYAEKLGVNYRAYARPPARVGRSRSDGDRQHMGLGPLFPALWRRGTVSLAPARRASGTPLRVLVATCRYGG